jgi:hypothetical protein
LSSNPIAAHPVVVYVRADSQNPPLATDIIPGANEASFGVSGTMLDVTDFAGDAWKKKLIGLREIKASLGGHREDDIAIPAASQAWLLRQAAIAGTLVWFTFIFNSAANPFFRGYQFAAYVGFETKASVDGLVTESYSIEPTGAPLAV